VTTSQSTEVDPWAPFLQNEKEGQEIISKLFYISQLAGEKTSLWFKVFSKQSVPHTIFYELFPLSLEATVQYPKYCIQSHAHSTSLKEKLFPFSEGLEYSLTFWISHDL